MLEDLLEQEKREKEERERQVSINNEMGNNPNSSSLLSDQDFERLRADVLGAPTQAIPAQGLLPIQQQPMMQAQQQQFNAQNQQGGVRPQFIGQVQWKANMNVNTMQADVQMQQQQHMVVQNPNQMNANAVMDQPTVVKKEGCSVPLFVANLQAAPSLPPDNIVSEQDRQAQMLYEKWLSTQENVLNNQRKYYETEVSKLRKTRKSLNSKQRMLKKAGNDLTESDTIELNKVTADQTIVQKQLENARKQSRQHTLIIQDYKNKQQQRNFNKSIAQPQVQQQQMVSPINQNAPPQMMASSPSSAQQSNLMQISAQSPIGNPMLQPSMSPLHSPSPLMAPSPTAGK